MTQNKIIVNHVLHELESAETKHKPFASPHEGYAVILEKLEELWEKVKKDDLENAAHEATQVAAMSIRFLKDLYTQV